MLGLDAAAQTIAPDTLPGKLRDRVDVFCEWGILGLVLAILIFGPLALGAARASQFVVVEVCAAAALALWVVRIWIQPRYRLLWPPICWAIVAFLLYAICRCRTAELEYVARHELIRVLVYGSLFFVILNNLNRRESAPIIALALIALAVALSAFSFYQFATHYPKIWHFLKPDGYLNRGSGTYINPNHLAGLLEMILPLALGYTLLGRFPHSVKVLLGYSGLVILGGIIATVSRGGIIAAMLTMVIFFLCLFFNREYWLRSVLLVAVFITLPLGFATQATQTKMRFDRIFTAGKMEDDRFQYWKAAEELFAQEPILGVGPGHFDQRFWAHRPPAVQSRPQYAHNDYLNTLCDWGVVGLTPLLAACILLGVGAFQTWPFVQRPSNELGSKNSNKAALVLGGSLSIVAILLHSALDFNMQIPANAILAVTLLALVSAHLRFASDNFWVNPGKIGRVLLCFILLSCVAWLGAQSARAWKEASFLQSAANETSSDKSIDALKKAFEIEPSNFQTAYSLGELYRLRSWNALGEDKADATQALGWFARAMALNRYDPLSPLRYGMCLDWLGKCEQATFYFERARQLDPNGAFVTAYQGWHCIQLEDYPQAKRCLENSLRLYYNEFAADYLRLVNEKLTQSKDRLLQKLSEP